MAGRGHGRVEDIRGGDNRGELILERGDMEVQGQWEGTVGKGMLAGR